MMSKSRQNSRMKSNPGTTCTDSVLLEVYNSLITDFNREMNTDIFNRWRCKSIKEYRKLEFPDYKHLSNTTLVKCLHQLKTFFSRYTATNDLYLPEEVEAKTFNAYVDNCVRVATFSNLDTIYTNRVLGLARSKARKILGTFDKMVMFDHVRFGRRAAIGIPYAKSYLDCKMEYPISCDPKLCELFEEYLVTDPVMQEALCADSMMPETVLQCIENNSCKASGKVTHTPIYQLTQSVNLSLVPKKFDKLRPVTPYSVVSILLSLACGDYMVDCLKKCGLDLSELQEIHRKMVSWMSTSDRYGTADMKAASDSIRWQIVRRVIPTDWYNILKNFQVKTVTYTPKGCRKKDRRTIHTETFLGMGSGITFPLQTLIFYCIVDAVRELLMGPRGFVSVYGDDLIYPTKIHRQVTKVFSDIGFVLNQDKTFMSGPFRESCGEDCHKGTPVRPFCFEGQTEQLRGAALGSFLFKTLNGLSTRWVPRTIPTTIHTLYRWISASYGKFHLVPPNFPDYSGLKVRSPHNYEEWYVPVTVPFWRSEKGMGCITRSTSLDSECVTTYNHTNYGWRFTSIIAHSEDRYVTNVYPYFWDWLRKESRPQREPSIYEDPIDSSNLRWVSIPNVYRKIRGRKYRKLRPAVSRKSSMSMRLSTSLVYDWVKVGTK